MMEQNIITNAIFPSDTYFINHSGSLATKTGSSLYRIQSRTHAFFKASSEGIRINCHKCLFCMIKEIGHSHQRCLPDCLRFSYMHSTEYISTIMAKLYLLYPAVLGQIGGEKVKDPEVKEEEKGERREEKRRGREGRGREERRY